MNERRSLLGSIARTIKDYRADDRSEPTPEHVDRWIQQFNVDVQLALLREMDHVLKWAYVSQSHMRKFSARVIGDQQLAGKMPREFWQTAHLLDIQRDGNSQTEIRKLFSEELEKKYGITADECGAKDGTFVYFDDVLFSGSRIRNDLSAWIVNEAPPAATVHIIIIAVHRYGYWSCREGLEQEAKKTGKQLNFRFWAVAQLENRKMYRNVSDVLWSATLPDDIALRAYMEEETKFPFEPRTLGGQSVPRFFSSEEGRQLLERELLLAGMHIRSLSQNPKRVLRPLGFSPFGLGFGSMIVTYRNCPNNAPLALWWGDPDAEQNHPLSQWYPLVQRKTYSS